MEGLDAVAQPEAFFASQQDVGLARRPVGEHHGFEAFELDQGFFLARVEPRLSTAPGCVDGGAAHGVLSWRDFFEQTALTQFADQVFTARATPAPISARSAGEV